MIGKFRELILPLRSKMTFGYATALISFSRALHSPIAQIQAPKRDCPGSCDSFAGWPH